MPAHPSCHHTNVELCGRIGGRSGKAGMPRGPGGSWSSGSERGGPPVASGATREGNWVVLTSCDFTTAIGIHAAACRRVEGGRREAMGWAGLNDVTDLDIKWHEVPAARKLRLWAVACVSHLL